jgi:hypothetical protein
LKGVEKINNSNQKRENLAKETYLHDLKVIGRKGKEIYFLVGPKYTPSQFDQLTLDYLSSEFHRFDACIMSLKKIGEYPFDSKQNFRFVTDLGAAAYILMHKYKVIGKRGKAIYFEVDDVATDKFDEIALEYISSDFHRFDSCLMSLKKIGEYISEHS